MKSYSQRAPFNDWWYWTEALIKRFRTIGDVYKENMENERATDAHAWADKLRKNVNKVVDEMRKIGPKPNDEQKKKLAPLEEEAIFNAATLFREILLVFPFASGQMQEMLGIAWQDAKWEDDKKEPELDENGLPVVKKKKKIDGRAAELFWGPKARPDEGIRSGKVEDGGLPGILFNLLAAEKSSSSRAPTDYGQAMQAHVSQALKSTGPAMKPGGFPG